jgi:hypothetical protein
MNFLPEKTKTKLRTTAGLFFVSIFTLQSSSSSASSSLQFNSAMLSGEKFCKPPHLNSLLNLKQMAELPLLFQQYQSLS